MEFSNIDALPMGRILQPSQGGKLSKLRMPARKKKQKPTVQTSTGY